MANGLAVAVEAQEEETQSNEPQLCRAAPCPYEVSEPGTLCSACAAEIFGEEG